MTAPHEPALARIAQYRRKLEQLNASGASAIRIKVAEFLLEVLEANERRDL